MVDALVAVVVGAAVRCERALDRHHVGRWQLIGRQDRVDDGRVDRALVEDGQIRHGGVDLAGIDRQIAYREVDDRIFYDEVDDNGNVVPGLLRFLTISSDLLVNINTAPLPVLRGLFRTEDRGRGDDLYRYRTDDVDKKDREKGTVADRLAKDKRGKDKEDEDRTAGATFQKVDDVQKIPTFAGRVLAEVKPLMTVNSKVFSIWATAQTGNLRRMRHWIVRREEARFVLVLCEAIDADLRPRFREPTDSEKQQDPNLKDRAKRR